MSQYTTGELAKQCNVTVRTVQFYDQRGILVPSSLTEGGRRLYSEDFLKIYLAIYLATYLAFYLASKIKPF